MTNKKTYREIQSELDEVLSELQSGELDIDDALKKYERGSHLLKELERQLKMAENKITQIKLPKKG